MFNLTWNQITGPGGNVQFEPEGDNAPDIIMLTTDLALRDDDLYRPISQEYAANISLLEEEFGAAWYRLMTADMGPHERW
jgi:catalase-peroxidase